LRKNSYFILALLCICSVYLFETYILSPATENYQESLATRYKTLQRYEYVLKGAGATEGGVKALANDLKNIETRLITEKSDFLASARLQREITGLTNKAGLNVATIRPMNEVKLGAYRVILVYFEGNGDIKQVSEFLKLVESDPLMLKIDKLSLNITNMQNTDDLKFKIQISALSKL
jgi:hypothetical protein